MPTTPLLGITELSPSQSGKETTINDAILALEAAGNATLALNLSVSNSATLSVAQFTGNFMFRCSGQTGSATLNIPALVNGVNTSRIFSVRNNGNFALTVKVNGSAGTSVALNANETRLLDVDGAGNIAVSAQPPSAFVIWTDATTAHVLAAAEASGYIRMTNAAANTVTLPPNSSVGIPVGTRIWIEQAGAGRTTIVAGAGVTLRQSSTQAQLYLRAQYSQVWATKVGTDEWVLAGDFGGLLEYSVGGGAPSNIQSNEYLLDHAVVRSFTLPANFAGSQAGVGTNPAATYVLTVLKNGVSCGSITYSTSGAVTFATTGGAAVSFVAGDVLSVQAPSTIDSAVARVRFTLKGSN